MWFYGLRLLVITLSYYHDTFVSKPPLRSEVAVTIGPFIERYAMLGGGWLS